jgi:hypothetical protein
VENKYWTVSLVPMNDTLYEEMNIPSNDDQETCPRPFYDSTGTSSKKCSDPLDYVMHGSTRL